jgi:hypothetical protein
MAVNQRVVGSIPTEGVYFTKILSGAKVLQLCRAE